MPAPVGVAVETWIAGEGHLLKVAADVANGSKHMTLDRMRAEGSSQTRNSAHLWVGRGLQHEFFVADARSSEEYEAVELADRCLDEWGRFIVAQGLAMPTRE